MAVTWWWMSVSTSASPLWPDSKDHDYSTPTKAESAATILLMDSKHCKTWLESACPFVTTLNVFVFCIEALWCDVSHVWKHVIQNTTVSYKLCWCCHGLLKAASASPQMWAGWTGRCGLSPSPEFCPLRRTNGLLGSMTAAMTRKNVFPNSLNRRQQGGNVL